MAEINSSISNSESRALRDLGVKFCCFLPVAVLVAATNFLVDPSSVYRGAVEKRIVDIMASGKNVANVRNYNERLVQKFYIEQERTLPDIVVIGSSRSLEIGSNIFPNTNIVNNSVTGAALGDYLGILYNYDKRGRLPKRMILGVDPWLLNPYSGEHRWVSLKEEAFAMLKKIGVGSWDPRTPFFSDRLLNIVSFTYFQASIRSLFEGSLNGRKYFPTDEEIADYPILLKDGRHSYQKSFRSRFVQEVSNEAREAALDRHGPDYDLRRPDSEWAVILEKLISYLGDKKIEIVLYLAPYHPDVYNSFVKSPQKKVIVDIENYYRDVAKRHHLRIIGSYDPKQCGLVESDFYDPVHAKEDAVERIFKRN
jgi:hypothetical protein